MTARVLGWVARLLWPPAAVLAVLAIDHTGRLAATGDPLWWRLRALIAICALFAGLVAAITPRSPR